MFLWSGPIHVRVRVLVLYHPHNHPHPDLDPCPPCCKSWLINQATAVTDNTVQLCINGGLSVS